MRTIHYDLLGTQTRYVGRDPDLRSRVLEAGEGDALILLHGGGGHAETYSRNLVHLGSKLRVLAPDFLWHGLSATPAYREGNWLRQFTEQILHLMDCEGIDKASVEGESLGAWIGLDMAINYPDRLERLILNTAWGMRFDSDSVDERSTDLSDLRARSIEGLRNLDEAALRSRLEWLVHDPAHVTDELVALRLKLWSRPEVRTALTTYYEHVFSPEMDPYLFDEDSLRGIGTPTLVLWTEHNPFHGVDAARRLAELIPGAQLHVVQGAGHWPQWENPEEHDHVVLEFLGIR
ncbi:alpha/beta fold hydrolase [Pseudonocardia asaccharolytica]|uniref:2-hydroxy-6-ketonona-2,4-dienedioic acid hydrolase n=1 Tax=Pseudonocardia asaccharolytica DSM 44247 = NBRC 16224 TaxID=1123024 RepID=A0A511CZG5_9PSEU|nr:alpha/beta hydrolase [Pseudonocardia asaccharolytica]GEL17929.1 2-hydroxy-6-ketonona-2,4-dienedioic acid hydrolase [Pseudonocardia asaccharolytica DSM 44247 = NBRC 16224]